MEVSWVAREGESGVRVCEMATVRVVSKPEFDPEG